MIAIMLRTWKDRRLMLFVLTGLAVALIWMYVAIYPSIQEQSANFEQLLKTYPEALMKAFNIDIQNYTTTAGYLATEQFSFMWPLLLILMMVSMGAGAIAGEIEDGTIELLLSQPVSRLRIFFGKYLTGILFLLFFTFVSIYAPVIFLKAYNFEFHLRSYNVVFVLAFLFGLAIYSLSMFFTTVFSSKSKVYIFTIGILVAMYVANIVYALKDSLKDLKYFSFFYYFNASKAMIHYEIDHWAYLIFIGVAVMATVAGAIWFARRDIAV